LIPYSRRRSGHVLNAQSRAARGTTALLLLLEDRFAVLKGGNVGRRQFHVLKGTGCVGFEQSLVMMGLVAVFSGRSEGDEEGKEECNESSSSSCSHVAS